MTQSYQTVRGRSVRPHTGDGASHVSGANVTILKLLRLSRSRGSCLISAFLFLLGAMERRVFFFEYYTLLVRGVHYSYQLRGETRRTSFNFGVYKQLPDMVGVVPYLLPPRHCASNPLIIMS